MKVCMEVLKTIKIWAETPHTGVVERKQMEMEFIKLGLRLQIKDERQNDGGLSKTFLAVIKRCHPPPPPKVLVFINVPKLSSACLMPIISPFCLHSLQTLEIKTSWAAWKLKEVARKTRRQGRHRWVDWWGARWSDRLLRCAPSLCIRVYNIRHREPKWGQVSGNGQAWSDGSLTLRNQS